MLNEIIGDYDGIWVFPRGTNKGGLKSYKGKCPCITISSWQYNFMKVKNGVKEKFTAEECEKIQTLPTRYTRIIESDNKRIKLIGNSWTVDVISHLLNGLTDDNNEC